MTNDEQYLRQRAGQANPFRVPEGYFEQFADQLMSQLPPQKPKSRLVALRPWLYAAACIALLAVMGVTLRGHQQTPVESLQAATVADNTFMEEAADYAMIDNMDIYACLSDN